MSENIEGFVAVKYLVELDCRAPEEVVSYDLRSAERLVQTGNAEYVDPEYVYVPAPGDEPIESAVPGEGGTVTQAVLTPANLPPAAPVADVKPKTEPKDTAPKL